MGNTNLHDAKRAKNDEFYTQFADVERELLAYVDYNKDLFRDKVVLLPADDPEWSAFTKFFALRFDTLGLRKLISTSYNPEGQGKVFTLERDVTGDGRTNIEDLTWEYLAGDGDFRSAEVTALRDEADFIITNPPFSIFREFLAWIMEGGQQFALIANKNSITHKETWPLVQAGKIWSGTRPWAGGMWFILPADAEKVDRMDGDQKMGNVAAAWFTNIDHARRHEPLVLMTEADNLRFGKAMAGKGSYERYDNYDAIEIPRTKAIPSDYAGVMGVPISFLDKFSPDQFEIVGCSYDYGRPDGWPVDVSMSPVIDGRNVYKRIFIKHINPTITGA